MHVMHDHTLRKLVDSMNPVARATHAKVVNTVRDDQPGGFWEKVGALVEIAAPIMTLLRIADGDVPATGKVYNEMFVLGRKGSC